MQKKKRKHAVTSREQAAPAGMRPQVLLLGQEKRRELVRAALKDLRIQVVDEPWNVQRPRTLDRSTAAVVLVPPLATLRTWRAVDALREAPWGGTGAVFAVVSDDTGDSDIRRIYGAGATAVFEWPRDALLLPDLLAQTLGIVQARGRARHSDTALARAVRARLKITDLGTSQLRVSSRDGVVTLSGNIDALWQRSVITDLVAQLPGVRDVDAEGLMVPPSGISDREVLRSVRAVLRTTPVSVGEALAVAVENGRVSLAGRLMRQRDLDRVVRAVSEVRGVRGVDRLAVVSPGQLTSDRKVAGRLRGALSRLFPDHEVTLKVFSGVVVLSGSVSDLVTKRRMEKIVAMDNDTARVLNKLTLE
jgi:osmotically-inducible protein OsmY